MPVYDKPRLEPTPPAFRSPLFIGPGGSRSTKPSLPTRRKFRPSEQLRLDVYSRDPAPRTPQRTERSQAPLGMTVTLRRLAELMLDEGEYDEGFLGPTRAAFDFAADVLTSAQSALGVPDVFRASPAAVGDGGIYIQWGNLDQFVMFLVPADPAQAYLYARDGTRPTTVREVTGPALASLLRGLPRA